METKITKDDLLDAKEVVLSILSNKKAQSKLNLQGIANNFYNDVYTKGTTLGLSTIAFNDNDIMKAITVLSGILTYEELRYVLSNIKRIMITKHKINLLAKEKYDKLLPKLEEREIIDINYERHTK